MATYHADKRLYEARRRIQKDGESRRVSFWAKTNAEAEAKADAASGGSIIRPELLTVSQYVSQTILPLYLDRPNSTRQQAVWAFDRYILPELGKIPVADLQLAHIVRFQRTISRDLSGSSVVTIRKFLHRVLRLLTRERVIPYNYLEEVDAPHQSIRKPALSIQEVYRLWYATEYPSTAGGIVYLAGFIGLRRGELLAIDEHDLINGRLWITDQDVYERGRGRVRKSELKTQHSRRSIPLPPTMAENIRGYARAGVLRGLHPTSLRKIVHSACKRANLPPTSVHQLRKTCTSALDEIGAPKSVQRAILGHGGSDVTDEYAHAREEAIALWLERLWVAASTSATPTDGRTTSSTLRQQSGV